MKHLLGIDIGTTGTKTLLFAENGTLLGHAYKPYPLHTPKPEWREQDSEDWWQAVVLTVREVCAQANTQLNIAAISLSTQGGTLVPVDRDFMPLRRAIVWNDHRCADEASVFLQEVGPAEMMYRKTGWKLGKGSVPQKIRWLKDHEPDLFEKTAMFLTVPDYISYRMTGIPAVDLSNLGNNRLCDIQAARYDDEILRYAGITEQQLPQIVRSGEVIGTLTDEAASAMGLSTRPVLVAGAHDQYAVALGAGANHPGDILIGSGTAWVITAIADAPDFDSGLAQSIAAAPGMWGSLSSLASGGVCLEWLRKNLAAADNEDLLSYDAINEAVSCRKVAEDGLYFYPFSGKSSDTARFTRASFVGLDLSHDKFHLARAIMEGVAFQTHWMMDLFRNKPSENGIFLAGGASKSNVWCQILADITGIPVRTSKVTDLACVGAAILAGVGSGVFFNVDEGYRFLSTDEQVIYPDEERTCLYKDAEKEYKRVANVLGCIE